MDEKVRCQSCGMPLSEAFGNYGTQADGTAHPEYCIICFKDGAFVMPHQTMGEMIQSSIDNMMMDLRMPEEKATVLARSFIPTLKRWQ